ncbi:hypothetical protein EPN44_15330 [bacterium]|nr:MAG: hypothetical protein EPN44_15330 [bacterium]
MTTTEAIDAYFFEKAASKADLIKGLLAQRGDLPAAQPYYRAFEAIGARAADEALLALRSVLAGHSADDERVKALRAAVAAGDRASYLRVLGPPFPLGDLHDALDEDADGHAEIDALHGELAKERPSSEAIVAKVERLRSLPQLRSLIANWWDDPRTQLFLQELNAAGL